MIGRIPRGFCLTHFSTFPEESDHTSSDLRSRSQLATLIVAGGS